MALNISAALMSLGFWLVIASLVIVASAAEAGSSSTSANGNGNGSSNKSAGGSSSSTAASQARQSAASVIGTIGSLIPGLVTNVAPLVLLFGLGALMMPALGMSAMGLLRESRRSSNEQNNGLPGLQLPAAFAQYARPLQTTPQDFYYFTQRSLPSFMSQLSSPGIARGLQDVLERVARALDNADKRYS